MVGLCWTTGINAVCEPNEAFHTGMYNAVYVTKGGFVHRRQYTAYNAPPWAPVRVRHA